MCRCCCSFAANEQKNNGLPIFSRDARCRHQPSRGNSSGNICFRFPWVESLLCCTDVGNTLGWDLRRCPQQGNRVGFPVRSAFRCFLIYWYRVFLHVPQAQVRWILYAVIASVGIYFCCTANWAVMRTQDMTSTFGAVDRVHRRGQLREEAHENREKAGIFDGAVSNLVGIWCSKRFSVPRTLFRMYLQHVPYAHHMHLGRGVFFESAPGNTPIFTPMPV